MLLLEITRIIELFLPLQPKYRLHSVGWIFKFPPLVLIRVAMKALANSAEAQSGAIVKFRFDHDPYTDLARLSYFQHTQP